MLNGDPLPLFTPGADTPNLGEHTLAFRVDVTPEKAGDQTFVFEAYDSAQNVITKEVVVTITVANRPMKLIESNVLVIM